ncbi:unnamed protein product [Cylicocyclus nassatus]|uniref:G-protein coupled receptors family 1 profile domain-containing protein n=1 Tax=Cylicocyclus nassatus TaxID=53992 RepID=A0AA36HBQ8_CYLNA|nr:unnamed protein product [Cylicocyclus nassatus]
MESQVSVAFQIFYTVVPLISIIGNSCIVYVTIRSRNLRSACNIFIALLCGSDVLHMFSHYVMLSVQHFSSNQLIPRFVCIRLQFIPLFGGALSGILIFSVAVDRLFSLYDFYYVLTKSHKRLYITLQVGTAVTFATAAIICTFFLQNSDEVICGIMDAMHGQFQTLYSTALCLLSFFTLVTYVIFLVKVRRKSIDLNMKGIYRSLIVTSFAIVFCTLAVGFGLFVSAISHTYSDTMGLIVGISINISIAANFFVYYVISEQYRTAINKYLYISLLKSALGLSGTKAKASVVTAIAK